MKRPVWKDVDILCECRHMRVLVVTAEPGLSPGSAVTLSDFHSLSCSYCFLRPWLESEGHMCLRLLGPPYTSLYLPVPFPPAGWGALLGHVEQKLCA